MRAATYIQKTQHCAQRLHLNTNLAWWAAHTHTRCPPSVTAVAYPETLTQSLGLVASVMVVLVPWGQGMRAVLKPVPPWKPPGQ